MWSRSVNLSQRRANRCEFNKWAPDILGGRRTAGKALGRGDASLLLSRSAVNFSLGGETREHSHPRVLPQLVTVLRLI